MLRSTRRTICALLPLSLLSGCAWILYPERRYQRSPGPIEVVPLVVDCLLFIPGIVPGVIALAVDFGTRAIYVPRGQVNRVQPGDVATLERDTPEQLELRVLDAEARELTRTQAQVDPLAERHTLTVGVPHHGPLHIELHVDGHRGASARITTTA